MGCVGRVLQGSGDGERLPRTFGLGVSLPFRHGCCMPGALRGRILTPWERGLLRLSPCHIHIACHGEAAFHGGLCCGCPNP